MDHRRGRPTAAALTPPARAVPGTTRRRAGISPATVARLERQPAAPCRCRTLGRLAAALGEDPATPHPRHAALNPRPLLRAYPR